ncbi:bacillithiol biosynthesis cysteine-adding enzyme BshC [Paludifilum halophilum]|nr:bacillithiol biosynthesis cysteine-adding enzyme BshC [Paludifilum halophilum]
MKIEDVYLDPGNPLLRDFFDSFDRVTDYYTYNPGDEVSFATRAEYLERREDPFPRRRLTEILHAFHSEELYHSAVAFNIERLERPDSVAIVGGQQAGILTGPLYTIYKAITLIQLARREEERLGRPVVPVFWIAGEDHDWQEVNHIFVPGEKKPIKHPLTIEENNDSVGRTRIDPVALSRWIDELNELLPDTEHKKEVLDGISELSREATTWSRHFARFLHRFFGRYGLVQIDSSDPSLRRLEVPFFQWLLESSDKVNETVIRTGERMEARGYSRQVDLQPNKVNLLIRINGERRALFREGNLFRTREGDLSWSLGELKDHLRQNPEDFTNNVVTRPLMQEYLFPTLATVVGPGEIAYWGLLKEAFAMAGMEMPVLYPRISLTLVDARCRKEMRRYGLTFDDVLHRLKEKRESWLQRRFQVDVEDLFSRTRVRLDEIYTPLIAEMSRLRRDLEGVGESGRRQAIRQVDELEKRTRKALYERGETDIRRFDILENRLHPFGLLQERVYNITPVWNRFGEEWVDQLIHAPLLSHQSHRIVHL